MCLLVFREFSFMKSLSNLLLIFYWAVYFILICRSLLYILYESSFYIIYIKMIL